MKEIKLYVPAMSCNHCVNSISEFLNGINEVETFKVNLEDKTINLTINEMLIDEVGIIVLLDNIGFQSEVI